MYVIDRILFASILCHRSRLLFLCQCGCLFTRACKVLLKSAKQMSLELEVNVQLKLYIKVI